MMTTFEQAKRMSKSDENSTTVKEASSGISTAMPSLADIPKPPMRRPLPEASGDASASATTAQKEPEEIQAVVLPMTPASAPPRPDMAPSRPQFSASELPVASEPVASEDVPKKNEKEKEEEIAPIVRVPSFMASAATPAQETVVTPLGEQEEISSKKSKRNDKKEQVIPVENPVITETTLPKSVSDAPVEALPAAEASLDASEPSNVETKPSITQPVFDEILRQHGVWLESAGREGRRANLYNLDLSSIQFKGANLQQANLRGVFLDGADLSATIFIEADLAEASIRGALAIGCNWARSNLSSAMLQGAILDGSDLSSANAIGANFSETSLKGAMLHNISLRDASLVATDFTDADFSEAVCRGADASRARFIRTIMTRTDMRETLCHGCEFVQTVLQGTNFRSAEFDSTAFGYADFSVAVDIAPEYQIAGFQIEKDNLEQEKHQLKEMEAAIQHKQSEVMEMRLQMEEQRTLIRSLKADETLYISGLQKIRSRLKMVRLIWALVLVLLVAVTGFTLASMSLENLNVAELGVVFIVPVAILLLVFFTLGQVSAAIKRVDHHSLIRERKITSLQNNNDVTGKRLEEMKTMDVAGQ